MSTFPRRNKTYSLETGIDVTILHVHDWDYPVHDHAFIEIILVQEGSGYHIVNGLEVVYGPDSLLLILPGDAHTFHIASPSTFLLLTFQKTFLEKGLPYAGVARPITMEALLETFTKGSYLSDKLLPGSTDRDLIKTCMIAIRREIGTHEAFKGPLINTLLWTTLLILARSLRGPIRDIRPSKTFDSQTQRITDFIHSNIYVNAKLNNLEIARHCGLSEGYVGQYFKNATGKTLKRFILDCKLDLAKKQLLSTTDPLKTIADRLGFADERHFSKLFKKIYGYGPSQMRRKETASFQDPIPSF